MNKFPVCVLCIFIMLVFPGILLSAPQPPSPTNVNIVSPIPLPVTLPNSVTIGNSFENPIPVSITNADNREYLTIIINQTSDSVEPRLDTDCPLTNTQDFGTDPVTTISDAYSVMIKIDQNGILTNHFFIPTGKRLVITDFETNLFLTRPSSISLKVVPLPSGTIFPVYSVFLWTPNINDVNGERLSVHLSTGIYVSDLARLCLTGNTYSSSGLAANIFVRLRGYLE